MKQTILYDDRVAEVAAKAEGDHLWLSPSDLVAATGWKLAPEGLCKGDACVRVAPDWLDDGGNVDLIAFAAYMGQPVVSDNDVVAFGESLSQQRDTRFSVEAPDFTLADINGTQYKLSDFRGKKVFLFTWGSY